MKNIKNVEKTKYFCFDLLIQKIKFFARKCVVEKLYLRY